MRLVWVDVIEGRCVDWLSMMGVIDCTERRWYRHSEAYLKSNMS